MKSQRFILSAKPVFQVVIFVLLAFAGTTIFAQDQDEITETIVYRGEVVNSLSGDAVSSAHLAVSGTNITTVTNTSGEFSLKVPKDLANSSVTISMLGYNSKTLPLEYFKEENTVINLQESIEELGEVSVYYSGDARNLVRSMLAKKGENYFNEETEMTAFYRETIKKRRRPVSLSEAVVKIHKQPYDSGKKDDVSLYKARKSTDYRKLDTVALKLRGGPFNTLYVDVMKYPEFLFRYDVLDTYKFSFDKPTKLNNRYIYVVDFEEKERELPWYHGQLFIDAESLTLVKAKYRLNVDNRSVASRMFVKKKPAKVRVYPVDVGYQIDYRENNGKWYYGYGNAQLEFVVNWKHKLFNSRYTINSEMAVTNWERFVNGEKKKKTDYIKPTIVMSDDVSGFADVQFWGNNNIIEPDKSIQNAIEKIQRQLEREHN